LTVTRRLFFATFVFTTVIGFIYCTCVRVFVCISLFVRGQAQPAFDLRIAIVGKNAKAEKYSGKRRSAAVTAGVGKIEPQRGLTKNWVVSSILV